MAKDNVAPRATYYRDEAMNALAAYIATDEWVGWQLSLNNYDMATSSNREQIRRIQRAQRESEQPKAAGIAAGILSKLKQHS